MAIVTLQQAKERHLAGDLAEARRLYALVLEQEPANADVLFRLGLVESQAGRPAAAVGLMEKAIAARPGEAAYQFGFGQVLVELGRIDEAVAAYRRVLAARPELVDVHVALGLALQRKGDLAGAIAAFQTGLGRDPNSADAVKNLGTCFLMQNRLPEAEAAYRRAIALVPGDAGTMSNLGAVLSATGRVDEAITLLREAMRLEPEGPNAAGHAANLGAIFARARRFVDAEAVLRRAVELDANNADAAYNLAGALRGQGKAGEALTWYRRAVALRPDYAEAQNNLGSLCKEQGDYKEALEAYKAAIAARPRFLAAYNNAGCLLGRLGRVDEAAALFKQALELPVSLSPEHPALCSNLGNVLKDAGEMEAAIACYRRALALNPGDAVAQGNLAYAMSFVAEDGQETLKECLRWDEVHAAAFRGRPKDAAFANSREAGRRLRVGYVSADFRDHCQALFTVPFLANHDHAVVEVYCYSSVERPDAVTRRIAGYADVWREVGPLDDAELAEMIRQDRIDILVDLAMHMDRGRPLLFARKPAPVQVAWLAYPGTTGLSTMDYRLTDPRLDPPGFDSQYRERSVRLPDSFWCYDPLTSVPGEPAVNELPALAGGATGPRNSITLGCLNNPCKLSTRTLKMWASVMQTVRGSWLMVMAPPGKFGERLLQRMQEAGIAPERVTCVPFRSRGQYLQTYHQIDLGLDTFPYNGHTTSLDSFWMGVPVVTRVGQTCVGRGGLSQLHNLGLADLAAQTDGDFVRIAASLANDLPRLAELRRGLRARMQASPLMDGERFARNMEAAYREMWRRWCG